MSSIKSENSENMISQPEQNTKQKPDGPTCHDHIIRQARHDYKSELSYAIEEVDLILSYLCRKGMKIAPDIIQDILNTKLAFKTNGQVSVLEESRFWQCYGVLSEQIKPATLASIKETSPSGFWQHQHQGRYKRIKRIPMYYGIAICLLLSVTVILQSYYMIGLDVLQKTDELFIKRNDIQEQIRSLNARPPQQLNAGEQDRLSQLQRQENLLDQQFDSNRILLYQWNTVWRFGRSPQVIFSGYDNFIYHKKLQEAQQQIERLKNMSSTRKNNKKISRYQQTIDQLKATRQLHTSRYLFFSARISAGHIIDLLESYILPLLLGCTGAFTLVLRSIYQSFREETFTVKSCLDYNLRILLGGVMGISSGMLFSDGQSVIEAEYSPMLIAFLIGYNVEILFSLMDNLARRLSHTEQKERT
ncbi:hypothetical protein VA7868_00359 [Vibrio aerogenes CECT 7868]|uniref:Uncharacterized protein n=1 Tax=Vibrio aerogenes CECT 7868 TaxID=1216006 RepID=A0A1M5VE38_9VIBR|nr:hypothetical protein [Vibrio aerogenes]SHH73517.1 hypothetical protein VA7868_00359 [Vibrio aerogenes CECT 7868]